MVLIISVATSLIWIKILRAFDDAQGLKSRRTAVSGFFLYGLLSVPLVLLLYALAGPLVYPIARESAVLENLFLVGPVEELGKFLVFYLVAVGSGSIQEPRDGVLHAASVGLAFAVVENVFYSVHGLELLLYRSLLTTAGHMSYAAIWGFAAGVYLYTRPASARAAASAGRSSAAGGGVALKPGESESFADGAAYGPSLVVSAVAAAALLHGLYNSFLDLGALGAALLLDAGTVLLALASVFHLKKFSPFTEFPFSQYRLAIPQLKEALRHNPENFVLNKRLGLHYIRSRDTVKGRRHLRRASQIRPRELSSRFYLALLDYLLAGRGRRTRRQRARAAVPVLWPQSREIGGATLRLGTKAACDPAPAPDDEARQALYRLAMRIPLKSLKQLRRQVKQVCAVHPRRRELFDLCDDLVARKSGKRSGSRDCGGVQRRGPSATPSRGQEFAVRTVPRVPPVGVRSQQTTAASAGVVREWPASDAGTGSGEIHFPEPPLAAVNPQLAAKKSRALGRIIEQKRREFG